MERRMKVTLDQLQHLVDGGSIKITGHDGRELGCVLGWTNQQIPAAMRTQMEQSGKRLDMGAFRRLLQDQQHLVPDERVLLLWDGIPLAVWLPAHQRPDLQGQQTQDGQPETRRRSTYDRLIDGEAVALHDNDGRELGYLCGWTNPRIPDFVRVETERSAAKMDMEAWQRLLRDQQRPLPSEVVLILWDDLPLAVWLPKHLYAILSN